MVNWEAKIYSSPKILKNSRGLHIPAVRVLLVTLMLGSGSTGLSGSNERTVFGIKKKSKDKQRQFFNRFFARIVDPAR